MNFSKTGRKFLKVGGEYTFLGNNRGKCTETGEIRGNSKFVADESQDIFREKIKL